MNSRATSSIIFSLCLLLIPLAIVTERAESNQWTQRLINPEYKQEIDRHSPKFTNGTFLSKSISANTTLSPDQNPIIISSIITLEKDATLTILPGTQFFVNEFSGLLIKGSLNINGEKDSPVVFTTNELHPDNQTWNGLTFESTGHGNINHTHISFASPAISCLKSSKVSASNIKVRDSLVGIITESNNCTLINSSVFAYRDGIIQINSQPQIVNTVFSGNQNDTRKINTKNAP